jgi:hypothetical protein
MHEGHIVHMNTAARNGGVGLGSENGSPSDRVATIATSLASFTSSFLPMTKDGWIFVTSKVGFWSLTNASVARSAVTLLAL